MKQVCAASTGALERNDNNYLTSEQDSSLLGVDAQITHDKERKLNKLDAYGRPHHFTAYEQTLMAGLLPFCSYYSAGEGAMYKCLIQLLQLHCQSKPVDAWTTIGKDEPGKQILYIYIRVCTIAFPRTLHYTCQYMP